VIVIRMKKYLCLFIFFSCQNFPQKGEIVIKNDIQDKEYNVIRVDQVQDSRGTSSLNLLLKPGMEKGLPNGGVTKFVVSREYKDHKNIYEVTCPLEKKSMKKPAVIKLIDIHLNRLPGGCVLSKFGVERDGFTSWK
jgi:hypothetical protein